MAHVSAFVLSSVIMFAQLVVSYRLLHSRSRNASLLLPPIHAICVLLDPISRLPHLYLKQTPTFRKQLCSLSVSSTLYSVYLAIAVMALVIIQTAMTPEHHQQMLEYIWKDCVDQVNRGDSQLILSAETKNQLGQAGVQNVAGRYA